MSRANVVGLGLIGGSVALGLRERGWRVTGRDADADVEARALAGAVVDAVGIDADAEVSVVATPVLAVAGEVARLLASTGGVVTDVGSTKSGIVAACDHPRFVGGHPMAGSEQEGLDGASADLFLAAPWVLTPTTATSDEAMAAASRLVAALGAEPVTLDPDAHDTMVAVVSHVPHLTAATLMGLADQRATEHRVLLRLAAGGFRDMTRIASGHPSIWPDICVENRDAIVAVLDDLRARLDDVRHLVATGDRGGLLDGLERARKARTNLPGKLAPGTAVAEVRVPLPDRKGELAAITRLAADLDVNILDIEVAHSAEGDRGVAILVVRASRAERLTDGLSGAGYHPVSRALS